MQHKLTADPPTWPGRQVGNVRRGFKAEAERLAERTRTQMGLRPYDRLDIRDLALHLNVEVIPADQLVDRARLEELERLQPGAFSAATFHLPDGRTVAVCNPCNDLARTNSDIAHELAHILLDHDVREIQQLAGHTFITCNPEQEEEANWLAGCLLLPRPLLLREAYAGTSPDTIAAKYQVSLHMARFRLNTSGVLLQARRARTNRNLLTARGPVEAIRQHGPGRPRTPNRTLTGCRADRSVRGTRNSALPRIL